MRIYNKYIITLAVLLLSITTIFTAMGRYSLDIYFNMYLLGALVVTELYAYINKKARRGLNLISIVLSSFFIVILLAKVTKFL